MKVERVMTDVAELAAIADALRYPVRKPERFACEEAAAFFDEIECVAPSGMEELYTTTFDLNPVATLEVGWHLWGEQYERGRFMASLRDLQARLGIDSGSELPDHLTVLLRTIAAAPHNAELRGQCAKAIEKILKPLDEHGNPYRHLLRAALRACLPPDGPCAEAGHFQPALAGTPAGGGQA